MNFFKKLFTFKRTRMIDEAVFFHNPVTLGKNILSFIVTLIIASLIVAFMQAIPLVAYMFSSDGAMDTLLYGSEDELASLVGNIPSWITGVDLLFTGIFILVAIYYCKKHENRSFFTMGFVKDRCVPEYLVGFLIGGTMIGLTILLNIAFGTVEISFSGFSPVIFLFLIGFVVKGFAESSFVYGYFTVSVARDYAPIVAIVSGTFAYLAFSITGAVVTVVSVLNILLIGFFAGAYVFKRGSIFGISAFLSSWSFTQLSIFSPSIDTSPLVLAKSVGSDYITGGSSGVGGGLCATIILVASIFVLLLTPAKSSQISDFESNSFGV